MAQPGTGRRARDWDAGDMRTYLGDVTVDGGEILITDPGYIPADREAMLEQIHIEIQSTGGGPVLVNPWKAMNPSTVGPAYLAVAFPVESDGGYPVWAELGPDGRLLRVTIEVGLPDDELPHNG